MKSINAPFFLLKSKRKRKRRLKDDTSGSQEVLKIVQRPITIGIFTSDLTLFAFVHFTVIDRRGEENVGKAKEKDKEKERERERDVERVENEGKKLARNQLGKVVSRYFHVNSHCGIQRRLRTCA